MGESEEDQSRTSPVVPYQQLKTPAEDCWFSSDSTQALPRNTPPSHAAFEQSTSSHRDYEAPSNRQRHNAHFGNAALPYINAAKKIESNVMDKQPDKSNDAPGHGAEIQRPINPSLGVTSLLTRHAEPVPSTKAPERSNMHLRDYTQELHDHHDRMTTSSYKTELANRDFSTVDHDRGANALDIGRCVELAISKIREGGPVRPNTKWPSEHDDALVKLVQDGASLEQICDLFKPRTPCGICQHAGILHRLGKINGPLRDDIRVGMTLKDGPRMIHMSDTNEERTALPGSPPIQSNESHAGQAYSEGYHRGSMEADHGRRPTTETGSQLDPSTVDALRSSSLLTTTEESIREPPNRVQLQNDRNMDVASSSHAEQRNDPDQIVESAKGKIAKGGPIIAGTLWATEHDDELTRLIKDGANLDQICALFHPRTKSAVCRRALMFYQSGRIDGPIREDVLKVRGDRQDVRSLNRSNRRNELEPPHASARSQRRVRCGGMPYTAEEDRIIWNAGRNGDFTEELAHDMNRPSARALRDRHAILSRSNFLTSSVVSNRERRRSSPPISQENSSSGSRRRRPTLKVRENRSSISFVNETQQQPTSTNIIPESPQQESIRDLRNYRELTAQLESNPARYGYLSRQFEQGPAHYPQMLEQMEMERSKQQEDDETHDRIIQLLQDMIQSQTVEVEKVAKIRQLFQTLNRSGAMTGTVSGTTGN